MTDSAATKPCKYCAEQIKLEASKCVKCGNYQNWFAYVLSSASILSLLIALVSVIGLTGPIIKSLVTPLNSKLTYSIQASNSRALPILVSNLGNRPGGLSQITLEGQVGTIPVIGMALQIKEMEHKAALIIEPGESVLATVSAAKPVPQVTSDIILCEDQTQVYIQITSTDFQGRKHIHTLPLRCKDSRDFLSTLIDR